MTSSTLEARPTPPVLNRPPDKVVRWVAGLAALVSISAFVYFLNKDAILIYWDSVSHLQIARRLIDSPTPGYGQLGSVWLPLPHLLMLPFIGFDSLYFGGLAGSIVSMLAYVGTAVLVYKTALRLANSQTAGVVAALIFILNPNVLYMQSTPMTEMLMFLCIAGMIYGVQEWIQTNHPRYIIVAAISALSGTLTRYETWIIFAALAAILFYATWRKRGYSCAEGVTLSFLFFGGISIAFWVVYNWLTFGNPLNFINGEFAKSSLWVSDGEPAIGHSFTAFMTYVYAIVNNLGYVLSLSLVAGVATILVLRRLGLATLPVLAPLVMVPFFVYALYRGERPLHVLEINGSLYNVRFGLLMILPAAVLTGYLVSLLKNRWKIIGASAVSFLLAATLLASAANPERIITYLEPASDVGEDIRATSKQVSDFLATHYQGGTILMEAFGNEFVLPQAGITPTNNVYEGSYKIWEPTLQDPAGHDVAWIVMRGSGLENQRDIVYDDLYGKPQLDSYKLVFQNAHYYVYQEKP